MTIEERIAEREKIRAEIGESVLLLISESIDDYIESRIKADNVLVGILKDIQNNTASFAETNRAVLAETRSILAEDVP